MIGIIIRFWHNDRKQMDWRFNYFASCVLPRLQAQQNCPDFDICMLSDPQDHARIKALDNRIKPFTMNTPGFHYRKQGNFKYSDVTGLKKYPVQVRIDSDDLVTNDFLSKIMQAKTDIVTFQPQLFLLDELRVKNMAHRYRADWPSAFLAVKNYPECIYHKVFLRYNDRPGTIYPAGTAFVTIHGSNTGTNKNS